MPGKFINEADHEEIDRLVERIVQLVNPLRILVFRSSVRGNLKPDSDIDVLVVMPEGTYRRQTAQHLYQNITHLGIPFDIIVATPSDLEKHKNNIGLIYRTVLSEGKEIYAT